MPAIGPRRLIVTGKSLLRPDHLVVPPRGSRKLYVSVVNCYTWLDTAMDAVRNPYSPGAGRRPPALVGRDFQIRALDVLLHRATIGRTGQGLILSGLRGVGKTVLLNELAVRAGRADWIVSKIEAHTDGAGRDNFQVSLARGLHRSLRQLQGKGWSGKFKYALSTFKAFSVQVDPTGSVTFGVDVRAAAGRADTGNVDTDLVELAVDLAEAAAEQQVGVGIFIDEMQDVSTDVLRALISAAHEAGQRDLPFYIIGGGLPSLPRVLAEAKSYAERLFDFHTIGHLAGELAAEALVAPALAEGARWSPEALHHIVTVAGGYPYFLQEFGSAAWNVAVGPVITPHDAGVAEQFGQAKLDAGFFASRWGRATPAERDYLTAMAIDAGNPSQSSEVAARMARAPASLGPARASLINKGLIYAPEHGQIAYTVPGMAQFIVRQKG